jgi:lipopolysaccharide biosynthesis regulator YciM
MDEQTIRQILKFTKRVRRDRYAKVYAPLADGLRRVGLLDEAAEACRAGLQVFPRYLACNEVLGRVHLRQNKLADAKRELEKVHEVIGENLELRKALAKVYARGGEKESARGVLEWVVAHDPFDFEMRNILTQLRREADQETRGADGAAVDIYELAEKSSLVDIRSIVGETAANFDHGARVRATDEALDSLEHIETSIDAEADRLVRAAAGEAEIVRTGARPKKARSARDAARRQQMLAKSVAEISAAAVIAQIEIEISLLDEALLTCRRLMEKEQDADLQELADKFEKRLEEKEAELDKLESINLARGL